jgi:hypothetical protein
VHGDARKAPACHKAPGYQPARWYGSDLGAWPGPVRQLMPTPGSGQPRAARPGNATAGSTAKPGEYIVNRTRIAPPRDASLTM